MIHQPHKIQVQVWCGRLSRLDPTCFYLNQIISHARQRSNKPSCIFGSYQLLYCCKLGKLKCLVEEKERWQVSCLLEHLCIGHQVSFSFSLATPVLPASGVPSRDLCVVAWQGMRDRLQSLPASCCILYSSACGLSTGDQKPRGTSLRLLREFLAVV